MMIAGMLTKPSIARLRSISRTSAATMSSVSHTATQSGSTTSFAEERDGRIGDRLAQGTAREKNQQPQTA